MLKHFQHYHRSLRGFAAVAGIFSILICQLIFTAFIATTDLLERSEDLVLDASSHMHPVGLILSDSVAEFPPNVPAAFPGDQILPAEPAQHSPKSSTVSYTKKGIKRPLLTAKTVKRRHEIKPKALFANTIITIGKPSVPVYTKVVRIDEQTPSLRVPANNETRKDKRSLVASLMPIVKKPFGWMRSIGSKIF